MRCVFWRGNSPGFSREEMGKCAAGGGETERLPDRQWIFCNARSEGTQILRSALTVFWSLDGKDLGFVKSHIVGTRFFDDLCA